MTMPERPPLPCWLLVPLALAAGMLVAVGTLGYSPQGRINVFYVWLIWAGLPLLGALGSLLGAWRGADRPWLFRLGQRQIRWFPDRAARWWMLYVLQSLWCLLALGMLVGYGAMLLFTDLAFGWSSTVLTGEQGLSTLLRVVSLPWQTFWPSAVPDAALLSDTRFQRIAPDQSLSDRAGDWWPFLLASLLAYNLIPRVLLASWARWQWRRASAVRMQIRGQGAATREQAPGTRLVIESRSAWSVAGTVRVNWEQSGPEAELTLGQAGWREDQEQLQRLLMQPPERLLWQVAAERSPVAELADLIREASEGGVAHQGLYAPNAAPVRSGSPAQTAYTERHRASWQAFARQHGLAWVVDNPAEDQEEGT